MNDTNVKCFNCHRPAYEHCYSDAGRREVGISGLCEECFDEIMNSDNEEDEDWRIRRNSR